MKNTDSAEAGGLPLCRPATTQPEVTTQELVHAAAKVERGGMMEARLAAIARSGLLESEVRDALGIAPNQWSQMKLPKTNDNGEPTPGRKHFPEDLHQQFELLVGNDLVTRVVAYRRGLECKPLKTALEQENETLRTQLEEQQRQHAYLLQALKEIKGG